MNLRISHLAILGRCHTFDLFEHAYKRGQALKSRGACHVGYGQIFSGEQQFSMLDTLMTYILIECLPRELFEEAAEVELREAAQISHVIQRKVLGTVI